MAVSLLSKMFLVEWPRAPLRWVAIKLADASNDEGEHIYPSVGRIERETGLSESAVRQALADLEEAGLLVVVKEGSNRIGARSTTERSWDLEALLPIVTTALPKNKFVPSTHVLAQDGPERDVLGRDGKPTGKMLATWRVRPRTADDACAYFDLTPAGWVAPWLAPAETVAEKGPGNGPSSADPAPTRVQVVDPTLQGMDPRVQVVDPRVQVVDPIRKRYIQDPSLKKNTPPPVPEVAPAAPAATAGGGGFENQEGQAKAGPRLPKRWVEATSTVAELLTGRRKALTEAVVLPLLNRLGPPEGSTPDAYVRALAHACDGIENPADWPALVEAVAAGRARDLPPLMHAKAQIETVRRSALLRAADRDAMAALALPEPTPVEAAAWIRIQAEFAGLTSPAAAEIYLRQSRAVGLIGAGRVVTLIVGTSSLRKAIAMSHSSTLHAAFARALGRHVEIEVVEAARYVARVPSAQPVVAAASAAA
jgi:DNA-binding transcriptional ArsR family regulator